MIFQIGWAALAAIFTFSIAMVVWGEMVTVLLTYDPIFSNEVFK